MQTSDRFRIFRSLGLAVAALLLVGGAVFGSNALTGDKPDDNQPSASADLNDDDGQDGSESPEASKSPEASAEELDEDLDVEVSDDDGSESPEASESETELDDESESPEASASPDDHGDDSGHDG